MANVFDDRTTQRIVNVIRHVETLQSSPTPPQRHNPSAWPSNVQFVQVTSLTPTDGRYPGKRRIYDPAAKTFSNATGDVWIVDVNGNTPSLSTEYVARLVGYQSSRYVFAIEVADSVTLPLPNAASLNTANENVSHGIAIWNRWTITTSDLTAAATSQVLTLNASSRDYVVDGCMTVINAAFGGGGATTVTLDVGKSPSYTTYASTVDLTTTTLFVTHYEGVIDGLFNSTNIYAQVTSDVNVNTLTTGTVNIYLRLQRQTPGL